MCFTFILYFHESIAWLHSATQNTRIGDNKILNLNTLLPHARSESIQLDSNSVRFKLTNTYLNFMHPPHIANKICSDMFEIIILCSNSFFLMYGGISLYNPKIDYWEIEWAVRKYTNLIYRQKTKTKYKTWQTMHVSERKMTLRLCVICIKYNFTLGIFSE